jgi:hypothetical protein
LFRLLLVDEAGRTRAGQPCVRLHRQDRPRHARGKGVFGKIDIITITLGKGLGGAKA